MLSATKDFSPVIDRLVSWWGSRGGTKGIIRFHYDIKCKRRGDTPEMTLIATVWSPEGFAIAADGWEFRRTSSQTEIGDVQKIFYTQFANETGFAWAWYGATGFESAGRRFDFKEITESVMSDLPDDAYLDNPENYFARIARKIYIELPNGLSLSDHPDAEVIFVGYLAGKPLWVEISFSHTETTFLPPTIKEPEPSPRYFHTFCGSHTVCDQMQRGGKLTQPLYLSECISSVQTYAETCIQSRGTITDCQNFGGTVHIATVTKEGFTWIKEPKNLSTSPYIPSKN